jgi:phosphate:Na+ symporter
MEQGEELDSHTLKNLMHHEPDSEYVKDFEHYHKEYLAPLETVDG